MILGVTGHRRHKLGGYVETPWQLAIRAWLRDQLIALRPSELISGMADGVDQWAVREAIKLGIPFTAAVPFPGQASTWPVESRREYEQLLSVAKRVVVVTEQDPLTKAHCRRLMYKRDDWIVEKSDNMLAVWDGSSGGTYHTVDRAEKKRARQLREAQLREGVEPMRIVRLNPLELLRSAEVWSG